jgi:predicted metal-dependent phosphoesterase TrpH
MSSRTGKSTLIDLHVHTSASPDSSMSVKDALTAARTIGLDGIAVTDHNTMEATALALELAMKESMIVIPGVEVSTREGHLLALGVSRAPAPQRPIIDTLNEIHMQGGIAVLSHPYRRVHGAGRVVESKGFPFDAIEVLNGHTDERTNTRARNMATAAMLPMTGGSDAHKADEIGRCFTEFSIRSSDVVELFRNGVPQARGKGVNFLGRVSVGLGNAGKRAGRGFKPI